MNKSYPFKSQLNSKLKNSRRCPKAGYENSKKGNILYTTLSFLFICTLLYTVNLQIYQSARKNLHNIERAYQAQTLAVLATEYDDRHGQAATESEADASSESTTAAQTKSEAAPAAASPLDDLPPDRSAGLSVSSSSRAIAASATQVTLPEKSALEETGAEPQMLWFNMGYVTIDPSQQPRIVTVKLHDDPLVYRFSY